MKKILAWVLLLALCMSLFAGCNTQEPETTEKVEVATEEVTEPQVDDSKANPANALAYVKNMYKNAGEKTPKDFNRVGIVTIGGKQFEVVWTANVGEEHVKIVKNDNGMVTIDVNEQSEVDVPYVLTAAVYGENGEAHTYEWNHLLPIAMKVEDIIKDAFALKDGEVLPYEASLTGEVVSVDTPYDDGYKNITVSIAPTGFEDKVIKCYRLKGEGVEKIVAGNIITVTGTIKNYKGTIEFDQGCIMDAWEEGNPIIMPTDPHEIVDMAWDLPRGQSLPAAVTLTGIITSIDTPYDAGYGNITVTIAIPGRLNKPIQCYRMKGADLDKLKTSDEITVTGTIINYNGTREFNSGCQLLKCVPGSGHVQPKDQVQVVKEAYALPLAGNLLYTAELTGKITKVNQAYSAQYGNITVTFVVEGAEDMPIQCYRMTGDASKLSKLKVGDTITVRGLIKNYYRFSSDSSTIQYDKPVLVDAVIGSGSGTTTNSAMKPIADPVPGTAYQFGFRQNNLNGKPFCMITGNMDGYYGETTTNHKEAIDTYLEATSGGYYIYTLKGSTKKYINIEISGTHYNVVYKTAPSSVWQLNKEHKYVWTTAADGVEMYLGTYSNYNTLSASKLTNISDTSKIGVSNFCAWFLEFDPNGTMEDDEPTTPGGNTSGATMVTAPQAETAYKMGMDKGDGTILYFNGKTESASVTYRLATTTDVNEAVDVFLESATGGYRLYFMNGSTKTYIRVFHRTDGDPGYGKGSLEFVTTAPSEVFVYDTTAKTLFHNHDSNNGYYMGTYSSYTTFSVSNTSYITGSKANTVDVSQFPARFYTVGGSSTGATVVTAPQAETAYKMGMDKGDGEILYFNGKTESASVTYRLATTTDVNEAVDVFLESATGGYRLYFMNGSTKTYIRVFHRTDGDPGYGKGSLEFVTTAPSEVFVYDTTAKTLFHNHDSNNGYYMGTYSSYTTFSVSNTSYITGSKANTVDVSQFPARFYTVGGSTGGNGGSTTPDTPDTPDTPATAEGFVADPKAETSYKLGLQQNGAGGKVYYFTGSESGNYLGTTDNISGAADVKLETVSGGFRIYTEKSGTKYYITIEKSISSSNGKTYYNPKVKTADEMTPSVWVLNKDHKYITTTHSDGTEVVMGTYSTYTTISCSKSSFISDPSVIGVTQFCAWFLESTGGSTGGGTETPPATDESITGKTYTIANYPKGSTSYTGSEEHVLDSDLTITVYNKAYFAAQLRLYNSISTDYPDAHAILKFGKAVTKLQLNAGYKDNATLKIWVSNDGVTWTALSDVACSAAYAKKTIDLGGSYTYVKLQAIEQIRITDIVVQFAA